MEQVGFGGGGVKFLEPLKKTMEREVYEETGLRVAAAKKLGVYEIINPPDEHRVIVFWRAHVQPRYIRYICQDGFVAAPKKRVSDTLKAKFFTKEEIKKLVENSGTTEITLQVLMDVGFIERTGRGI